MDDKLKELEEAYSGILEAEFDTPGSKKLRLAGIIAIGSFATAAVSQVEGLQVLLLATMILPCTVWLAAPWFGKSNVRKTECDVNQGSEG